MSCKGCCRGPEGPIGPTGATGPTGSGTPINFPITQIFPSVTSSFIIAYALSLAVLVILYATSSYVLSSWEYIIILIVSFIVVFSVTNLIYFHSDRYPLFYIRSNCDHIAQKLNINLENPGKPIDDIVPHRTEIRDVLKI